LYKKKIDVIVAFSFGEKGTVNKRIAERVIHIAQFSPRAEQSAIFTQRDLEKDIFCANKNCTRKNPRKIDIFIAPQSEYISTLQVVKEFAKVAQEKKWKNIAVVGHHMHIWRCCRDLKKFGFTVVHENWPRKPHWDTTDPQWWVRSKFLWWCRELPLRLLPFKIYEKKCG
jgi:hypothetical protein